MRKQRRDWTKSWNDREQILTQRVTGLIVQLQDVVQLRLLDYETQFRGQED